mmetsp:Transcript_15891/g.23068  ORF Transcript_15891/g.23068 Transcript_15891/m.23068 type:complete len:258 (+) Transcript_15891:1-774(+)
MNLSWLYLTLGLGSFVGPATSSSMNGQASRLVDFQLAGIIGLFINFIGNAGMGASSAFYNTLFAVCLFNICRASGGKIVSVNSRILLQRFPEDEMLGRVMSLDYVQFSVTAALGATTAGLLRDVGMFDAANSIFIISCGLAIVSLYWICYHYDGQGAASNKTAPYDRQLQPGKPEMESNVYVPSELKDPSARRRETRHIFTLSGIAFIMMAMMIMEIVVSVGKDRAEMAASANMTEITSLTSLSDSLESAPLSDFDA